MSYTVEMTPTAQSELHGAFAYIHSRAPLNATRWLKGIYKAIDTLEELPTRCGIAPESQLLGETVRHYLFKSHRIIFVVEDSTKTVRILHVRHGKMEALGAADPDE